MNLPDMQKSTEGFKRIPIKKVGMRNVELPLQIFHTGLQKSIEVKGMFSSYCNLVEGVKGINMSRISRTLIDVIENNDFSCESNVFAMMELFSKTLQKAHNTDNIFTKVKFDYPIYTQSPYTTLNSPEYTHITLETNLEQGVLKKYLTVSRVGMSLCPCSKEMSLLKNNLSEADLTLLNTLPSNLRDTILQAGFGAHNQRSHIDVTLDVVDDVCFEDIFVLLDRAFSCPTKTVLKRPDEKYETEVSYMGGFFDTSFNPPKFVSVEGSGPKFVEDIARDVADQLNTLLDTTIADYTVVVNNDESIHSGNILATAVLTAGRSLT